MLERFTLDYRAVPSDTGASDWLDDLRRGLAPADVRPGGIAATLTGDPNDSLPLERCVRRWGAPNRWMMDKGLDPFAGRLYDLQIGQAAGERATRCLVPVTGLAHVGGALLRDPNRPLLTLAGLVWGAPRGEDIEYGFCFLAERKDNDASSPLAVAAEHHATFMDSWLALDRVLRCCEPLVWSRLVAVG